MTLRKVLITGGAGFIGRYVSALLQQSGYWVRWLDSLDPQIHGAEATQRLPEYCHEADEMLVGDVRSHSDWQRALQGVEYVIHLAAQTGTGQSMYQVARYTDVNIGGTAWLWEMLANEPTSVKKVVVASSRSIYGEGAYLCLAQCGRVVPEPRTKLQLQAGEWEVCCPNCGSDVQPIATPESSIPQAASLYACTKLAQEQMSLTMGKALGISTVVLRFQNVYGPGQSLRNPYTGIISIFSNQLRQSLPVNVYEDGLESRDFVFIDDVARACAWAVDLKCATATFNVGRGQATTVIDLAHALKKLWNSSSPITISGDFRVGDIRHNWADSACLQRAWPAWQATRIENGLAKFVQWAQTQPIYADQSQAAAQELKTRNL